MLITGMAGMGLTGRDPDPNRLSFVGGAQWVRHTMSALTWRSEPSWSLRHFPHHALFYIVVWSDRGVSRPPFMGHKYC